MDNVIQTFTEYDNIDSSLVKNNKNSNLFQQEQLEVCKDGSRFDVQFWSRISDQESWHSFDQIRQ